VEMVDPHGDLPPDGRTQAVAHAAEIANQMESV
jgi:hypothetical protein